VSGNASIQETCVKVAQILHRKRVEQNLSLTRVAEGCGLSRQGVSYLERGMRIPNLDTLLRIAAVLNVDLAEVIREASGKE